MNDKKLAKKVLALGVGESWVPGTYELYDDNGRGDHTGAFLKYEAAEFVRDWRVAGALMEKVDAHFIEKLTEAMWAVRSDKPYGQGKTRNWYENESLPRAIVEACVEALS